jgi:YD repeat-containing protein
MSVKKSAWLALLVSLLSLSTLVLAQTSIDYEYDELGRLLQSTDSSGNVIQYRYDARGNILQVSGTTLATVTVSDFTPDRGPVGSRVVVLGSGFSTTPSSNVVRFNGVAATVVSATRTELTVTVGEGATTGLVSVTTGDVTATSALPFTIAATPLTPTISSFTPTRGAANTGVTITGTNFDLTQHNNKVTFGGTQALVTSVTATQLNVTVPPNAGSGKIGVLTPYGSAQSANDFLALPPTLPGTCGPLGTVGPSGRVNVDGAGTALVLSAGQSGAVLFDGAHSQYLTVKLSAMTAPSAQVAVISPQGAIVSCGTVTGPTGGLLLPTLPDTGTYTLWVSGATGNTTVQVQGTVRSTLVIDGAAANLSLPLPARRAVFTFTGTAGRFVTLTASDVTLPSGTITIFSPNGTPLVASAFTTAGASLSPQLPANGTYTVLVDPAGVSAGNMTLTLASSASANIAVNGTASTSIAGNGAGVRLGFTASAGQRLTLVISTTATVTARVSILSPSGALVIPAVTLTGQCINTCGGSVTVNTGTLPASGRYSILVEQLTGSINTPLTLTLTSPVDRTALAINSVTSATSPALLGQGLRYFVDGTAGQRLTLDVTSSGNTAYLVSIYSPSGTLLVPAKPLPVSCGTLCGGTATFNTGSLPQTGRYTILVEQTASGPVNLTLTLSALVPGSVLAIPSSTVFTPAVKGQGAVYSFDASAGQRITLDVANTGQAAFSVSILAPTGALVLPSAPLVSTCAVNGGCSGAVTLNTGPLAQSGRYSIVLEQTTAQSASVTLSLTVPIAGPLLAVSSNTTFVPAIKGQGAMYQFDATAGQRITLDVVNTGQSHFAVSILGPSGDLVTPMKPLTSVCVVNGGCGGSVTVNTGSLAQSGRYTIVLEQSRALNANVTIALTAPTAGPVLTVPSTTTFTPSVRGQGAVYSFDASVGQRATLALSFTGAAQFAVSILSPSGNLVIPMRSVAGACSRSCSGAATFNTGPLPATGRYTILLEQTSAVATTTVTLALTVPTSRGVVAVPSSSTFTPTISGQGATYQFDASAGQQIRTDVNATGLADLQISLIGPSGALVVPTLVLTGSCPRACGGSASLTSGALPQSGRYTILIEQSMFGLSSATVSLATY